MAERKTGGAVPPQGGPVVLTLDAGGTNFAFNAIQSGALLLDEPVLLPACGDDLKRSLGNLVEGFTAVRRKVEGAGPVLAVSFAFPGPADYEAGIIGDLDNLPAYRGAVPLGPFLEKELGLPVFIRNDGDLFAYGVALHGELPELNRELEARGSSRRLDSVLGMTLGTGWGCGFTTSGKMFLGSSSTGCEIGTCPWCDGRAIEDTVSRKGLGELFVEELRRFGCTNLPDPDDPALPKQMAEEARTDRGTSGGAARRAFERFGEVFAFGAAWTINLFDPDLVIVGGGLAGAWDLFFPAALQVLRSRSADGRRRVFKRVFSLQDPQDREAFLADDQAVMAKKKVALAPSGLPTETAIMLGAYEVALQSGRLASMQ